MAQRCNGCLIKPRAEMRQHISSPTDVSTYFSWGTSVDMDVHAIGLRASDRLIVDEWINFAMFTTRDHISTCVGSRW